MAGDGLVQLLVLEPMPTLDGNKLVVERVGHNHFKFALSGVGNIKYGSITTGNVCNGSLLDEICF